MQQVQVDPDKMAAQDVTPRPGHGGHRRRARRRPAAVLRRARHRHRRLHRHPQPAAQHPSTCHRSSRADDLAEVTIDGHRRRTTVAFGRCRRRWSSDHQPLAGDAVINDGPGLLLVVEKFPWGNTLDVTRGVEQALDESAPGPAGHRVRHATSSARRLHRDRDRQPGRGAADRRPADGADARCLPVRLAHRADQRDGHPAVADGGAAGAAHCGASTINTMILAGFVIALGDVVDDAIIDVENIVRRLRQDRRAGQRPVHRRGSSWTPRSRCAGAIVYATLIEVVARRCRCSSCPACRARSSGRWPCPTRWPSSPRWPSR